MHKGRLLLKLATLWLAERRTLLLEVPIALAPETWNVLINPQHPEFGRLKIAAIYEHAFDARLFSERRVA